MYRVVVAIVVTLLLGAGCGSGGGDASSADADKATSRPTQSSSPSAKTTYFVRADTDTINQVAGKAQQLGRKAKAKASTDACNQASSRGYRAWRSCWHRLLDPLQKSIAAVAAEFATLAGRDLPPACVSKLTVGEKTIRGLSAQVGRLIAGIDSETRADQVRSMRSYGPTLDKVAAGYTKPFVAITQVCYSPKDLASINASPSASPSASP